MTVCTVLGGRDNWTDRVTDELRWAGNEDASTYANELPLISRRGGDTERSGGIRSCVDSWARL